MYDIERIKANLESILAEKANIMRALNQQCTTRDMSDNSKEYGNIENVDYWADIIAMRKDKDGGPHLVINKDANDVPTGFVLHDESMLMQPTQYLFNSSAGRVQSEIPKEERNWLKVGFSQQPTFINNGFLKSLNAYKQLLVDYYAGKITTAKELFCEKDVMVFPNISQERWGNEKIQITTDAQGNVSDDGTTNEYNKYIDTSSFTNWDKAFYNTPIIEMPSKLDTSNATSAKAMFADSASIEELPEMDFSKVQYYMMTISSKPYGSFYGMKSLKNASKVTGIGQSANDLSGLFTGCYYLERLPEIHIGYNCSARCMLQQCASLVDARKVDGNPTDTQNMFDSCQKLLYISENLSFSRSVSIRLAFSGCSEIKKIKIDSLRSIDSTIDPFYGTFRDCAKLEDIEIHEFPTKQHTSSSLTFQYCTSIKKIDFTRSENANPIQPALIYSWLNSCPSTGYKLIVSEIDRDLLNSNSSLVQLISTKSIVVEYV